MNTVQRIAKNIGVLLASHIFCACFYWNLSLNAIEKIYIYMSIIYNVHKVIKLEIALRLPEELIEKADILAKLEYKNRAEIIKSALKEYIRRIENIEKLKERATELYLADKLKYNELVIIIGRQNADSVKASKRILDRGNKIAQDITRS